MLGAMQLNSPKMDAKKGKKYGRYWCEFSLLVWQLTLAFYLRELLLLLDWVTNDRNGIYLLAKDKLNWVDQGQRFEEW